MKKSLQVSNICGYLDKNGLDSDTIDVLALVDSTLSLGANKDIVMDYVGYSPDPDNLYPTAAEEDLDIGNWLDGDLQSVFGAANAGEPTAIAYIRLHKLTPPKKDRYGFLIDDDIIVPRQKHPAIYDIRVGQSMPSIMYPYIVVRLPCMGSKTTVVKTSRPKGVCVLTQLYRRLQSV